MNVRDLTLEWIGKAEEDAAVAERENRVRKQPSPGAVCYHAQQCIEKYLKAVLQEQGLPIPKIHDLTSLRERCQPDRLGALPDFGPLLDALRALGRSRIARRTRHLDVRKLPRATPRHDLGATLCRFRAVMSATAARGGLPAGNGYGKVW